MVPNGGAALASVRFVASATSNASIPCSSAMTASLSTFFRGSGDRVASRAHAIAFAPHAPAVASSEHAFANALPYLTANCSRSDASSGSSAASLLAANITVASASLRSAGTSLDASIIGSRAMRSSKK
eukprot:9317-Pelagococcus_subviridis.AAC.1